MIKHIVMFKLKESAEGANKAGNIQRVKLQLEALPIKIEEIKFFEVGINFCNNNSAFDMVLCSEFESIEDLYNYQKHPDHSRVAEFVDKVCGSRAVVDYVT